MAEEAPWVWAPNEQLVWVPAQLQSQNGDSVTLRSATGQLLSVAAKQLTDLPRVASSALQGVDDMVTLEDLTEPVILHTLRDRYRADRIYTRISSILVSVNPYKELGIYSEAALRAAATAKRTETPLPHGFRTAADAYHAMGVSGKNQAVIISGESGSGKTEATKIVLRFLSFVGSSATAGISAGAGGGGGGGGGGAVAAAAASNMAHLVEQKILDANPVIEAFGNARTVRNHNSSRFGKWVQVHFDSQHRVSGGSLAHYLLEKSRVTSVAPGERSFHIFYQVLAAAEQGLEWFHEYRLQGPAQYRFLQGGGKAFQIEGVSDAVQLQRTLAAMQTLELGAAETRALFDVVVAVLLLGNVRFAARSVNNVEQAVVEDPEGVAESVARLLGLSLSDLNLGLSGHVRSFSAKDRMFVHYTVEQALSNRDAFARHLYDRAFRWLLARINASLQTSSFVFGTIGVLDIFGFEIFEHNSLEQLLINFANEKLQQHFNHFIFTLEQGEYRREGLALEGIAFSDNTQCLELLERAPTGVLPLLDDEIALPRGSDETFLHRIKTVHSHHPFLVKSRFAQPHFTIAHYAGDVSYETDGFLEKNRDRFDEGLADLLSRSPAPFVAKLFEDGAAAMQPLPAGPATVAGAMAPAAASASFSLAARRRAPRSVCAGFREQLAALMATLTAAQPHFIRCIKPNALQRPDTFDSREVLRQLRYAGLPAVVRVRQQGLPVRVPTKEFVLRFHPLLRREAARGVTGWEPFTRRPTPGAEGAEAALSTASGAAVAAASSSLSLSALSSEQRDPLLQRSIPGASGIAPPRIVPPLEAAALEQRLSAYERRIGNRRSLAAVLDQPEEARARCLLMIPELGLGQQQCRVGLTKVFLAHEAHAALEEQRKRRVVEAVLRLQAATRGFLARQRARRLKKARVALSLLVTGAKGLSLQARLRDRHMASLGKALDRAAQMGLPSHMPEVRDVQRLLEELRAKSEARHALAAAVQSGAQGLEVYDAAMRRARELDHELTTMEEFAACVTRREQVAKALKKQRRRQEALVRLSAAAAAAEAQGASEEDVDRAEAAMGQALRCGEDIRDAPEFRACETARARLAAELERRATAQLAEDVERRERAEAEQRKQREVAETAQRVAEQQRQETEAAAAGTSENKAPDEGLRERVARRRGTHSLDIAVEVAERRPASPEAALRPPSRSSAALSPPTPVMSPGRVVRRRGSQAVDTVERRARTRLLRLGTFSGRGDRHLVLPLGRSDFAGAPASASLLLSHRRALSGDRGRAGVEGGTERRERSSEGERAIGGEFTELQRKALQRGRRQRSMSDVSSYFSIERQRLEQMEHSPSPARTPSLSPVATPQGAWSPSDTPQPTARAPTAVASASASAAAAAKVAPAVGDESDPRVHERLRKAQMRIRVQEMLIAKLQEKVAAVEKENADIRELYRDLNQSLFDKLAEYSSYRQKVADMERDYQARVVEIQQQLSQQQTSALRRPRSPATPTAAAAAATTATAAAGAVAAAVTVAAVAVVAGAAPMAAANGGVAAAASGATAAAPNGGGSGSPRANAREQELYRRIDALTSDLSAKCQQFMELQLRFDDVSSSLEAASEESRRLQRELEAARDAESRVTGGSQLKELVLKNATELLQRAESEKQALEATNAKLSAALSQRTSERDRYREELSRIKRAVRERRARARSELPNGNGATAPTSGATSPAAVADSGAASGGKHRVASYGDARPLAAGDLSPQPYSPQPDGELLRPPMALAQSPSPPLSPPSPPPPQQQ